MKSLFKRFIIFARENNLLPKAICFLLSLILWAIISKSQKTTVREKISIEYKNLSEQLVVSESSKKYIYVNFEGNRDNLGRVNLKNIKAYVDLSKPNIGEFKSYYIQFVKQNVPENIEMSPSSNEVRLKIERLRDKWVKVRPKIVGELQEGRMMGKPIVNPEFILVSGAISKIKEINFVDTDAIEITNQSGILVRKVEIDQDDFKDISFNETTITITIPIIVNENIYNLELPIKASPLNNKYKYKVKDINATIYLKSVDDDKLRPEDIEATVQLSEQDLAALTKNNKKVFEKELPIQIRYKASKELVKNVRSIVPEKTVILIQKR